MRAKRFVVNSACHVLLAVLSFIWVLPIFYVILTSFRKEGGSYKSYIWPKEFTLDNYTNYSLESAITKLSKYNMNIVAIGDGDTIINQYPKKGFTLLENGRLFFLTDYQNITMADLTGFNKKEVLAYCDLANIKVNITGSGYVVSQSIKPDEIIDEGDILEIVLG